MSRFERTRLARAAVALGLPVLAHVLAACVADAPTSPIPAEGGPTDAALDAAADVAFDTTTDAPNECGSFAIEVVPEIYTVAAKSGEPPERKGGEVPRGLHRLVSIELFVAADASVDLDAGASSSASSIAVRFDDGTFEALQTLSTAVGDGAVQTNLFRGKGAVAFNAGSATFTKACGDIPPIEGAFDYETSGSVLILRRPIEAIPGVRFQVLTFAKL